MFRTKLPFPEYFFFLCATFLFAGCGSPPTLFEKISSSHSGVHFNNRVTENDSINPIDMEFLYHGGGVATGDFNNDGLPDLYFTGSMVSNKLYLNRGNFEFEDITAASGTSGSGRWCTGVTVVDINNDGWPDIYVCTSIKKDASQRQNLLYVNQGPDKNGIPVFKEMAKEYGLADTSYAVQVSFFDYDNDGDLDMYLVTTRMIQRNAVQFNNNNLDTSSLEIDRLYRNDWNDSLHHPVFTDVSRQAGIREPGYGMGVVITDINQDGWKDIYVSNDFVGSDLLYINNRNGTFSEQLSHYFKHTSQNAMGLDIADINNDGLDDIFTVDMDPADNYRKKKNMNRNNYYVYLAMVSQHYMLQYVRNTLQLNQGFAKGPQDSAARPIFSETGYFSGVAETDWSWNPSLADFDNDGYRDMIITNGYPRDVTDHDFLAYRQHAVPSVSKRDLINQIPQIKLANFAFRNQGDLHFENKTKAWGMDEPSFSNGGIYVDLDNDGDLDYVINNINDEAFIYRNRTNEPGKPTRHFLDIRFHGGSSNINGIGARAEIHYGKHQLQAAENTPYRGYLSTIESKVHFGLGDCGLIDSVIIFWNNHLKQTLYKVAADQEMKVDIRQAIPYASHPEEADTSLFTEILPAKGISYIHKETDYIDFDQERLLPHKLSEYGPGLAVGDMDGNGLDDILIGGNRSQPATYFLQQPDGKMLKKELPVIYGAEAREPENMGLLLFDADNDGDNDLYCTSGSNEFAKNTKNYQDRFYLNDGKGNFQLDTGAIPVNYTSKSCIKAADFDKDGRLDLFVGGRVIPGNYPLPVSSFIYRNTSVNGHVKFVDVTHEVCPQLEHIGLVCDAIWTDFDNDGWMDLIVAGEWMPIRFFRNDHGKFKDITQGTGISNQSGWWNSILAGDFDNDGDMDYVVGNLGLNSFYRASEQYPVRIYASDFDHNGVLDAIPTLYLPDQEGRLHEYPAQTRDDIIQQLPGLRKRFPTYKDFAKADIHDILSLENMSQALELQANQMASVYIENLGNGKFAMRKLPAQAQLAPVYGMQTDDFNGDGNLDLLLCGNDFGTEVSRGRYDALNGLLLLGDGNGNFTPLSVAQSGIYIPGDARAMVSLAGHNDQYLVVASQNRGELKTFLLKQKGKPVRFRPDDITAYLILTSGKTRKEEAVYGNSFLSQSARLIRINSTIKKLLILNSSGEQRSMTFGDR